MDYDTRKETAAILGVSLTTLDNMRKSGRIGFYQSMPGGKLFFSSKHMEQYWEQMEKDPKLRYVCKRSFDPV